MSGPIDATGNGGGGQGLVDLVNVCDGCCVIQANAQQPLADGDMPFAIGDLLTKWMLNNPVRVRETLPIVKKGNMVALFVWFDRAGP